MRPRNEFILAELIAARAEATPDLDVLTFEHPGGDGGAAADEVRTFADLHAHANRIAAALVERGVKPGDRFALMMQNHPEFVETMIAASISGAIFVPIDPRTRGDKLAFMLANSGCAGIVCGEPCLPEVEAVRARLPDLRWTLVRETTLREVLARTAATVDVRAGDADAPLQIMYTSGTTGDPKGIVGANYRFCAAGMLGTLFGYRSDDRPYTGLSLTHGNAQAVTLAPALVMGLRAVFSPRFTKSRLWDVCRRHGCTTFSLVGGMATAIYSEPPRPDDGDNPVRLVVSGGMPPAIWRPFETRFGVDVLEFYGAMDGGGMAYKPVGEGPVGSFGKPMPGIEMQVLDEAGNACAPGVVGEICVRPVGGGEASVEYHGNPEASRRKIRGGWNRSGDMGHSDAHGWLFFDYRAGGGIRHNGDFIDPSFVEKAIAELPEVTDVFVYGVGAASGAPGEKDVVAAIVAAPGARVDPATIYAACRRSLEANFVPSYLQIVDEIPKSASEKPQERFLRERFDPGAPNVHRPPSADDSSGSSCRSRPRT
ncbi:MAG: AMP-binding protein [Deltaproteobacteria bacterium]|nr:AMP-binding protein [Deltaproteobacteria bacterium]